MSADKHDPGLLEFINSYRDRFAKYSLMYAGPSLDTIEAMWHMLCVFEDFAVRRENVFDPVAAGSGKRPEDNAYAVVAQKYRCGNWTLGSKVKDEMCKDGHVTREAAEELVRRLREVDLMREKLRSGEIKIVNGGR